jgi:hypothetical protein
MHPHARNQPNKVKKKPKTTIKRSQKQSKNRQAKEDGRRI